MSAPTHPGDLSRQYNRMRQRVFKAIQRADQQYEVHRDWHTNCTEVQAFYDRLDQIDSAPRFASVTVLRAI